MRILIILQFNKKEDYSVLENYKIYFQKENKVERIYVKKIRLLR